VFNDEVRRLEQPQEQKDWRKRAVVLAVVWILLFAASVYLLDALHTTFESNPQGQAMLSRTWAGYVVESDLENPSEQVVGVNASWKVPRVNVYSTDTFSSTWIGIGGRFDKTLIQAGTEQDAVDGNEFYSAWYELLPGQATRISGMSVSPGDLITASITLVNSDTEEWGIRIYDATTGQGFYQTFIYNSSRLSAEWVVESPTVEEQVSALANFGTLTFTDAYAKIGGNVGAIGNFSYSQVIMTNDLSLQLASVSPLSADGASFNVTYLKSG
jgi:hypothetical protein